MAVAADVFKKIQKSVKKGRSFVGVDTGSYTTKIVQLSMDEGVVRLETYGEILNSRYLDAIYDYSSRGKALGAGVSDLMHEVDARSRSGGFSIPLGETLINVVDLPKRDPEQMRIIVPVEAKRYIPTLKNDVMLEWFVLPQKEDVSAFDQKPGAVVEAKTQKVMLVAIQNDTGKQYQEVAQEANVGADFFEIEMFSAVRACAHSVKSPTLILDFGAGSTKAYIVNEEHAVLNCRSMPIAGRLLTEAIRSDRSVDFPIAEKLKREHGLTPGSVAEAPLRAALTPMWTYVIALLNEYHGGGGTPIEKVFLCGGGSLMPGISHAVSSALNLPTEMVRGFERTKGPMIMEDTLKEDGPLYAVAVGLALRGIGK